MRVCGVHTNFPNISLQAEQKLGRARDEYRAYTDKYEMVRADFEERMEKSADAFEVSGRGWGVQGTLGYGSLLGAHGDTIVC